MSSCKIPVPVEDEHGDNRWLSLHNRFLAESMLRDVDVIFIGDSIIQALQHTEVWNELFVPLHCLNFGIHRDLVQNVLWRVQNGELENVKPKAIVLHVGTNNYKNTPEEIVEGILEIISAIRERHPEVYIVVPTLLPRGENPNSCRDKLQKVNELLQRYLKNMHKLEYVKIDKGFVQPDVDHQENQDISHSDTVENLELEDDNNGFLIEPASRENNETNHINDKFKWSSWTPNLMKEPVSRELQQSQGDVGHYTPSTKNKPLPRPHPKDTEKEIISSKGTISHRDMYDYLLLTNAGSRKAFEPVYEMLLQLLYDGEAELELNNSE